MTVLTSPVSPAALLPADLAAQLRPEEFVHLVRQYMTRKAAMAYRGVDYAGLTTEMVAPVVAPARVGFRDVTTGQWIEGLSEPKIDPNHWRIDLNVHAYDPCRHKRHWGRECGCKKKLVGMREGPANLCTNVFANLVRVGLMGTNTTVTDATGTGRALTKTLDGGVNSMLGCAGTGGTAATVADTNMQTQTETQSSVTVNTVSGSGASGTFTVTFTITATADRAYTEVGLKAITTTTSWNFLLTHDSFSVLNVSNSGTLATTYTFTNS
jgi:hypothetical protein